MRTRATRAALLLAALAAPGAVACNVLVGLDDLKDRPEDAGASTDGSAGADTKSTDTGANGDASDVTVPEASQKDSQPVETGSHETGTDAEAGGGDAEAGPAGDAGCQCSGSTPVCFNSQCVECQPGSAATCANGTTLQTCTTVGTIQTQACAAPAPYCLGGACVPCASSADCTNPKPVCDTTTGQCGACTSSTQCTGSTRICDTSSGACVQCAVDNDCSGTPSTPLCGVGGVCMAWPAGKNGPLHVVSGQVVTIDAGAVDPATSRALDYSSITIDQGGTLSIVANGNPTKWTYIGVAGPLTINGKLVDHAGEHTGGTFPEHAPGPDGTPGVGEAVTATISQVNGGAGGLSGWTCANLGTTNLAGGLASSGLGNGGGGGGSLLVYLGACGAGGACTSACGTCSGTPKFGSAAGAATTTAGGAGGGDWAQSVAGATGATAYGVAGNTGYTGSGTYTDCTGGGGGFRGRHGGMLYLKVRGAFAGNGTLDVAGESGSTGGPGGRGQGPISGGSCSGGYRFESDCGGGGGGAGGSGGKVVIRYKQQPTFTNILVGGAQGGAGGAPGGGVGSQTASGATGQPGQAGDASDVQPF